MFTAAKDALASKAARSYANNLIGRYAELQDLRIDSQKKTIELVCVLRGEPEPVTMRVGRYTLEQQGDKTFIKIAQCACSRPWIQGLVEDFVQGQPIPVPSWAAVAL
jgi:hypothetical protein